MSEPERPSAPFEAHNIELPGGEQTAPQHSLLARGGICQASLRTLSLLFRPDEVASTSIVDLGCLEGGYAVEFARAGYQSMGIEVRETNMEKCRYVQQRLGLDNLTFVQDDVRNIVQHGPFDAVFCCGLFYHLDEPRAFLDLLAKCTRKVLILQTHVASDELPTAHARLLSPMTTHEGLRGRWYHEFPEDTTPTQIEEATWSSWGNPQSFWVEKLDLLDELRRVGFDCIYEQFDFIPHLVKSTYWEDQGRGMYIAIKSSGGSTDGR